MYFIIEPSINKLSEYNEYESWWLEHLPSFLILLVEVPILSSLSYYSSSINEAKRVLNPDPVLPQNKLKPIKIPL